MRRKFRDNARRKIDSKEEDGRKNERKEEGKRGAFTFEKAVKGFPFFPKFSNNKESYIILI